MCHFGICQKVSEEHLTCKWILALPCMVMRKFQESLCCQRNTGWLRGQRMIGGVQTGQISADGVEICRSFPAWWNRSRRKEQPHTKLKIDLLKVQRKICKKNFLKSAVILNNWYKSSEFYSCTTKPGYVMSCTALSIPGHVPSTKGHGLGRMVWYEIVLVQPGASLQNRWHRDRAAKSSQHPRHMDLSRLWSLTSWDPAVNLASVGDGKLVFFQEARWSGSSGVRKELLWLTLAQCTTLLNSSQGCKQPQAIWVGEVCGYFTLTCITGQYGTGIYQLSAEDWGQRG